MADGLHHEGKRQGQLSSDVTRSGGKDARSGDTGIKERQRSDPGAPLHKEGRGGSFLKDF